ncbi:MAG: CocE/NonD family hydrolase [Bacteroidetes bacterium]|nr:CocE/NonD family hydrolase [Bacteroidota bacterium]
MQHFHFKISEKSMSKYALKPLMLIVLLSFCCFSSVLAQQKIFDVSIEKNIMIPAEDGVLLATDIYRPAADGQAIPEKLPVLFQRTPYNKSGERLVKQAMLLASRGYVVALQDLRGRYASEGIFIKYNSLEASDGKASIEYLAQLPFSDGRVAMWGTSYGAHTQADASKLNPKGLSAMLINMGGMTNAWDHAVRQGGAFELGRELSWAWRQIPLETNDTLIKAYFENEKIDDWYKKWPFEKGLNPLSVAPDFEEYFFKELTNSDYNDYWKSIGLNWEEYFEQTADVPMVHIGGWYDIFLRGTIANYLALSKIQKTPKWLIIGPWTHSGNANTFAGDVDFGADAAINDFFDQYQLKWFNYLLKDSLHEDLPKSSIRLFVMGSGSGTKNENGRLNHGGFWLDADKWPLGNEKLIYHFHEEGILKPEKPIATNASTTFTFDPERPVPTIGGNNSARLKDGGYHQKEHPDFTGSLPPFLPLKARNDVVVFQTEPLEHAITVVGPIKVKLFCSSSATDTDFTVKLIDVYPPSADYPEGYELNLTDAIVRMSYRNGRHNRELINPGEVYELIFEPFPTANVFKKGHRIRVDISSSNFPRFDTNPNTGEAPGQSTRKIKADNTIFHNASFSSSIEFSILSEN